MPPEDAHVQKHEAEMGFCVYKPRGAKDRGLQKPGRCVEQISAQSSGGLSL